MGNGAWGMGHGAGGRGQGAGGRGGREHAAWGRGQGAGGREQGAGGEIFFFFFPLPFPPFFFPMPSAYCPLPQLISGIHSDLDPVSLTNFQLRRRHYREV